MSEINILNEIFSGYKIKAECVKHEEANNFSVFYIKLNPGCKLRSLENLATEIQVGLKLLSKPNFSTAPELGLIKMISTKQSAVISVEDIIDHEDRQFNAYVGVDSEGNPVIIDFNKSPHLLVAGATGAGKSVFLHAIIYNLLSRNLYSKPNLYLIDPKMVEFESYRNFTGGEFVSVKNTYEEAVTTLLTIHNIMDKRFNLLSKLNCKSVIECNNKKLGKFTRIICVIDELADLMLRDAKNNSKMETLICSIAAKARAAGIHLILATQRPSVDVITGLIKANFPVRACFRTSSNTDSRVVLDYKGAENLNGKGDGILSGLSQKPTRFQSAFADSSMIIK